MSRRKKTQLDTVEHLFAARESVIARDLAARQRSLAAARQQLQLLEASRSEHGTPSPGQSLSASEWSNRAAFLARLGTAIAAQEQAVQRAQQDVVEAQNRLAASRKRTRAIEKVSEKRRVTRRNAADQREQRELDSLPRGAADPPG